MRPQDQAHLIKIYQIATGYVQLGAFRNCQDLRSKSAQSNVPTTTNGTHLNDISIQKANLNPSDIVTIGKHDLKITSMDETRPAVEDLADKTIKVSG